MVKRRGFIGMQVGVLIKLVALLVILAGLGWAAFQVDIGPYSASQELSAFMQDVEYGCGVTDASALEDEVFSVPKRVDEIRVEDGNVLVMELDGGDSVELESSQCSELAICTTGTTGVGCETGGTIGGVGASYDLSYNVWYPEKGAAVIDPQE